MIIFISFSVTSLITLVILARYPIKRLLSKITIMYLWYFILANLVVPILLNLSSFIFSSTSTSLVKQYITFDSEIYKSFNNYLIYKIFAIYNVINSSIMYQIWLIGLFILLGLFILIHINELKKFKTALSYNNETINNILKEYNQTNKVYRKVQIKISDKVISPCTYGVLRPIIILPKSIDTEDIDGLKYLIIHELTHIMRLDIITKWLLAISLCIHWFNPLVWIMFKLLNRDIETACDERVIRYLGINEKRNYANYLIKTAEQETRFRLTGVYFNQNFFKERIIMILSAKKITVTSTIVSISLILMLIVSSIVVNSFSNDCLQTVSNIILAQNSTIIPILKGKSYTDSKLILQENGSVLQLPSIYSKTYTHSQILLKQYGLSLQVEVPKLNGKSYNEIYSLLQEIELDISK